MNKSIKARIFEIKRFAVHDGDGIRTTVFLKGCPLKCLWCHNPEGLSVKAQLAYYKHKCISCGECVKVCNYGAHEFIDGMHVYNRGKCVACGKCETVCLGNALTLYGKDGTVDELLPVLLKDKPFFDNSGGGVTLSGGECLMQVDFCVELLKRLKENGVNTAVDTCGFVSKSTIEKVIPFTDIFLYDIKAVDQNVHVKCTGQSNKNIIENLKYLDDRNCKIEIRIPYVPEHNDGEIEKIGSLINELKNVTKVRVLAYHNYAGSKYTALELKNTLPTVLPTETELTVAKDKIRKIIAPKKIIIE